MDRIFLWSDFFKWSVSAPLAFRSDRISDLLTVLVELQTRIFLRLLVIFLSIWKRLCKSFHTLVGNPDFWNNHVNTSHSLVLQIEHYHGNSCNIDHTSHVLVSVDNVTKDVISYTSLIPQIPDVGMCFLLFLAMAWFVSLFELMQISIVMISCWCGILLLIKANISPQLMGTIISKLWTINFTWTINSTGVYISNKKMTNHTS